MTRQARVTQAEIARALRAAEKSRQPRVVEVAPDGTIRLVPVNSVDSGNARKQPLAPQKDAVL